MQSCERCGRLDSESELDRVSTYGNFVAMLCAGCESDVSYEIMQLPVFQELKATEKLMDLLQSSVRGYPDYNAAFPEMNRLSKIRSEHMLKIHEAWRHEVRSFKQGEFTDE